MQSFRELDVWQLAMRLAESTYRATSNMPKSEAYGLTSQIRRATVSVPANIAEGQGRNNLKEYLHFLGIASGSNCELATLLQLTERVYPGLGFREEIETSNRVGMMLTKLKNSLRKSSANRPPTTDNR